MEVAGWPPGNDQFQEVVLEEAVLVNWTDSGAHPESTFWVKDAIGGVKMVTTCVAVLLPQALVEVRTTV